MQQITFRTLTALAAAGTHARHPRHGDDADHERPDQPVTWQVET